MMNRIKIVETISWSWEAFISILFGFIWGGMIIGLILGLIVDLKFKLANGGWVELGFADHVVEYGQRIGGKYGLMNDSSMRGGWISGLFGGLVSGLMVGIIRGFTDQIRDDKTKPNQGITLTLKNSIFVGLSTVLMVGLIIGLFAGLKEGVMIGLIVGLFGVLIRGMGSVIKHYSLRLVLLISGKIPGKFIPFLDYCAKLILLKKVGGGYIFIHRMLLEYFAKLRTEDSKSTKV
jgi:hypothetical protein